MENKDKIEIWKTVVEVQQHFNTIEMTIRNIFVTLVVAIVAGVGFSFKEGIDLIFLSLIIPLGFILSILASGICLLFYFIDRYWYHRLLVGSVLEAIEIEKTLFYCEAQALDLTGRIGRMSPIKVGSKVPPLIRKITSRFISDENWVPLGEIHSGGKISIFYKSVVIMFISLAVLSFAFHHQGSSDDAKKSGETIVISR